MASSWPKLEIFQICQVSWILWLEFERISVKLRKKRVRGMFNKKVVVPWWLCQVVFIMSLVVIATGFEAGALEVVNCELMVVVISWEECQDSGRCMRKKERLCNLRGRMGKKIAKDKKFVVKDKNRRLKVRVLKKWGFSNKLRQPKWKGQEV